MVIDFDVDWAQEVADVSGLVEYQNCIIEIRDPSLLVRGGSITTGFTFSGNPVVWTGQARVASTRTDVGAGGTTSTNPTAIKAMRVQIPYDQDFMRVRRGWQVRVTDGGRNARLEEYLFSIESDVNSSHVGSLTFNCTIDVESDPVWGTPTAITGTVEDIDGPLADVTVRAFYDEDGYWILALTDTTDSDGEYELTGTDPLKTYVLAFAKDDYLSEVYNNVTGVDLDLGTPVAHNATAVDVILVAV